MANAEARLRLIVESIDLASPAFRAISSEAQSLGLTMNSAINNLNVGKVNAEFSTMSQSINSVTEATVGANGQMAIINGNVDRLTIKLPQTTNHLDQMNKMLALSNLRQASEGLERFGKQVLDVLGEGIKVAAESESIDVDLSQALRINLDPSVASGQLDDVMKSLNDEAQRIAVATKFNTQEIQSVMTNLAENGIQASVILHGGAEAVADLAQATKENLPEAERIITEVFHGMGRMLNDQFNGDVHAAIMSVTDGLTALKLTTGGSLGQFADTMKYVLPIASEFGQSFDQVNTAVATLYRAGIQGSNAGTALRKVFSSLLVPTGAAREQIEQLSASLGYSGNMFIDSEGKLKSLTEIQRLLHDSTAQLGDEQKATALKTIFGQYALASMVQLASVAPSTFEELHQKLNQVGITQKKVAEEQQTLAFKVQQARENITVALSGLGEQFLPLLKRVADMIGNLAAAFSNLSPSTQKVIAGVAAVTGVLAVVVGTVGAAVASFGLFSVGLAAAGISLGAIASTVGIVIAALAAVGVAAYALYQAWIHDVGGIREFTMPILDTLRAAFGQAFEAIKAVVGPAMQAVGEFLKKFGEDARALTTEVIEVLTRFGPLWHAIWLTIGDVVRTTWDFIVGAVRGAWTVVMGVYDTFMGLLTGNWKRAFSGLGEIAEGALKVLGSIAKFGLNAVWTVFEGMLTSIAGLFDSIFHTNIADAVRNGLDTIKDVAWTNMQKLADMMWDAGRNLVHMIGDGIASGIQWVEDKVKDVANTIKSFLGFSSPTKDGPGSTADKWMPNMMAMLSRGMEDVRPQLQATVAKIALDLAPIAPKMGNGAGTPIPSPLGSLSLAGGVGRGGRSVTINGGINMHVQGNATRSDLDYLVDQVQRVIAMP